MLRINVLMNWNTLHRSGDLNRQTVSFEKNCYSVTELTLLPGGDTRSIPTYRFPGPPQRTSASVFSPSATWVTRMYPIGADSSSACNYYGNHEWRVPSNSHYESKKKKNKFSPILDMIPSASGWHCCQVFVGQIVHVFHATGNCLDSCGPILGHVAQAHMWSQTERIKTHGGNSFQTVK